MDTEEICLDNQKKKKKFFVPVLTVVNVAKIVGSSYFLHAIVYSS